MQLHRPPRCRRFAPSIFAFIALSAVSGLAPSRAGAAEMYTWKNVAIKGGGFVTGLVYHPTERHLLYSRTDVGGAFRWDEPGQRWIPLNDDLGRDDAQLTGVLSVALDPNDPDRVYLACGQYTQWWAPTGAIFRSTDRGATWARTTLEVKLGGNEDGRGTGERLQVDPNDGRVLLLGSTASGLWKSSDRAVTWTKLNGFTGNSVTWTLFDPRNGTPGSPTQTIYAGSAGAGAQVWRSRDGGVTWSAVPGQPSGLFSLHAKLAPDGALYLTFSDNIGPNGASRGAVWRLDTATDAWTNITPPAGQGGFSGISLSPSRDGLVVISTLDRWSPADEIYVSTDRGATWTGVLANATRDHSSAPYAANSSPHWITDVEVDPYDANRAFFVTGYGLFATDTLLARETGGQARWDFRNNGLEETVPLGLISPPTGARLVSTIGDIDGFRHDTLDESPAAGRHTPRVGTNDAIDYAEAAPHVMVRTHRSGTRGSITSNGASTWQHFASSPSTVANGPGNVAVGADGTRLVWTPSRSVPYVSTNGGSTWTASTGVPTPGNSNVVAVADRVDAATFYVYDPAAGRVYRSTDGGATFSARGSGLPTSGELKALPHTTGGHLWLAAESRGLLRSVDGGQTFDAVAAGTVQAAYRIGFGKAAPGANHPAVFIWGRVSGVTGFFRSDDVGATWVRINDDRHQFGWINAMTGDPTIHGRVYIATGGRGIIYGDLGAAPALLAPSDFAAFTVGVAGSYQPTLLTNATGVTFAATQLPSWAQFNASTGQITGTPDAGGGTLTQVKLTATDGTGASSLSVVNLMVADPGNDLSVVNLSTRAQVGTGGNILIPGVVIGGSGSRSFLIRAIGPTLGGLGVEGALADPQLTMLRGTTTTVLANDNWEDQPAVAQLRATSDATGAFPLPTGSKDAAALATLEAGSYTAKVEGVGETTGVALLEVYDTSGAGGSAQLANISVRAVAGSGSRILVAGIVVRGGGARRVLVRGVGPTLGSFGVGDALPDPQLTLNRRGTDDPLASSGAWGQNANAADLRAAAKTVSAFDLPEGSKDAALLPLLVSGDYTISLSSRSGATGTALIEVYLLPP